ALCLNSGVAVCQDDKCPREGAGDQCRTVVDTDLGSMALAFGVNVVLGGLVAGVLHGARGGDFRDAVVKGVTGGALSFAGKRLAVEPFFGAGLLGREVSAVG